MLFILMKEISRQCNIHVVPWLLFTDVICCYYQRATHGIKSNVQFDEEMNENEFKGAVNFLTGM